MGWHEKLGPALSPCRPPRACLCRGFPQHRGGPTAPCRCGAGGWCGGLPGDPMEQGGSLRAWPPPRSEGWPDCGDPRIRLRTGSSPAGRAPPPTAPAAGPCGEGTGSAPCHLPTATPWRHPRPPPLFASIPDLLQEVVEGAEHPRHLLGAALQAEGTLGVDEEAAAEGTACDTGTRGGCWRRAPPGTPSAGGCTHLMMARRGMVNISSGS